MKKWLLNLKDKIMAFLSQFQPVSDAIDALQAQVAKLEQEVANAPQLQAELDAANAQLAQLNQDISDTAAALAAKLAPPAPPPAA